MVSGIEGDRQDIIDFSKRLKNCAITVDILKYLNGLAIDLDYNRQIEPSFLDESMPYIEGTTDVNEVVADNRFPCVVLMAMPHYHKQGKVTEMHIRLFVEVIVKSNNGEPLEKEYTQVVVDVPMEAIEILPNIPEVRWVDNNLDRKERLNVWNELDRTKLTDKVISQFEEMLSKEREEE